LIVGDAKGLFSSDFVLNEPRRREGREGREGKRRVYS